MALPNGELQITPLNPQHAYPVDKRMQTDTLNSRDSISPYIRWRGMQVHVLETDTTYMLKGGVTNEFWTVLGEGSGGGVSTFVGQFETVDLLPATGSPGDYAYVGDSENFLQYNWDNIAGKWVSNATNLSPEKFYTSMVANGPVLEKVIFTKTLKDEVMEEDGAQVIYPSEMKNFIFTGSGVVLEGVGYADEENEFSVENRTDGTLSIITNGGVANAEFTVSTTIPVGGKKAFKGNGTTWDEVEVNEIAYLDAINSVNSIIATDENGLKSFHNIIDPSGETIDFKEVTQWFDTTPIVDADIIDPVIQKVGANFLMHSDLTKANTVSVEIFRKYGDTDYQTIQRAFDFISSAKYSYSQFSLRIPGGRRYLIDQPLILNTISDVDIIGDGMRKSSIVATAAMDTMITLSKVEGTTPFIGRCNIRDITIAGAEFADCLIDGRLAPYSKYQNIEFTRLAANGVALKVDGWVNTIKDNLFSNQEETLGLTAILVDDTSQVNGLLIQNNSISTYNIGLHINSTVNLASIHDNKFDYCFGAGIFFEKGSKGINIYDNYFERCGIDGITITKGATGSPTELWKGAIIGHHYYVSSTSWIYGLNIWGNIFAACSDSLAGTMTFSGLIDAKIEDNFAYGSNLTKYWVDLRWEGAFRTLVKRVEITQSFTVDNQVEQLIGMNADSLADGHCGIVAIENKNLTYSKEYSLPVFNNFMDWGVVWDSFNETTPYRGHKTFLIRAGSRPNKEYTITIDSAIAGRYYRINWFQKSATSATTSVDYKIDGVTNVTYSAVSNSGTWTQGGRGALIYIPANALTITFVIRISNQSVEREISGFSIVPSSHAISDDYTQRPSQDVFTVGGTPEGFQFAKPGILALDVFNGKAYRKTTADTLNTGWKLLADDDGFVRNSGAVLLTTDGVNLTGSFSNGAITKTTVTPSSVGYPVSNADVFNYNGASLQRTYSILKDRDSNDLYVQTYDASGVGLGWVKIITNNQMAELISANYDLNTLTNGFLLYNIASSNTFINSPDDLRTWMIHDTKGDSNEIHVQKAIDRVSSEMFIRTYTSNTGVWTSWVKVGESSYLGLSDTTDTTFTSKAFFVPSVSAFETGITLENPAIFRPVFTINDTTGSAWTASAIGDAVQLIRIVDAGGGTLAGATGMEFKKLTIINESASTFTLLHEDTGTTATNRFNFADSSNLVLPVNGWVDLMYVNGRYRRGL